MEKGSSLGNSTTVSYADSRIKVLTKVETSPTTFKKNLLVREQKEKPLSHRIKELAADPQSIFLDNQQFCQILGLDYPKYKNYVRSHRYPFPKV